MSTAETMSVGPSKRTCPATAPPPLTSWDPLPEPLIREVALCLSLKDCFSPTRVSKTWHAGINRASTWKQYVLREWPGMHVVVSRLEADAPGQSELCESFRELCIKMRKSSRTDSYEFDTRSAGDYEMIHDGGEENWSHLFTDVFLLVHVTNRHTDRVLHSTLQGLSDPRVVASLFVKTVPEPLELSGVHEQELDAFQDYKTTFILIDLRGAGVRVAQLAWAEDLVVEEDMDLEESIWLSACNQSYRSYSLGLESYPNPVLISCDFIPSDLGEDGAAEDAQRVDAEKRWELHVRVIIYRIVNENGDDSEPHFLNEVSAAYELLEPFVQSPSLLEWH